MADHKSYMHPSFPSSMSNEHGAHLNHEHSTTHEDPMLRERHEGHSADGAGVGEMMSGHGNRGTV